MTGGVMQDGTVERIPRQDDAIRKLTMVVYILQIVNLFGVPGAVVGVIINYVKRDDGVYEVFETEEKKAKIVFEDEEPDVAREEMGDDMTNLIDVPKGVAQYSSKLDPFFEPRTSTRANRQDYTAFTPGLERMFAPTEPTQQWY
jgi:hypothetical protein